MAITIIKDLYTRNPVRNEVRYRVQGEFEDEQDVRARVRFYFAAGQEPTDGDTIEFKHDVFGDGLTLVSVFILTFAATPDSSGTQVPLYTSGSWQDYIEDEVIPVIKANYFLYLHEDVNYTSGFLGGIELLAREYGFWNIAPVETGFIFGSLNVVVGALRTYFENSGLVFQLWVEDGPLSSDYNMELEELYEPDASEQAEIDVAEVLRDFLEPHMPEPDMDAPVEMDLAYTRFFFRTAERSGDPAIIGPMTQSDQVFAYLGGRKEVDRINDPDWGDQIAPGDIARFLTAWPNINEANAKVVSFEQREFLCFIVPHIGSNDLEVRVNVFYTDGTSSLNNILDTISAPVFGQMFMVACGIEARDLHLIEPTKTILHYRVRITLDNGTTISEVRHFRYDATHRQRQRQLHFFNSQGGVDTIVLHGERSNKPEADMLVSDRSTRASETMDEARDTERRLNTMTDAFQVGSAYLLPNELEAVKDLFASERIVERVGEEHWPVELLSNKGPESDEEDGLRSVQVKYRYALRNTAHSR